MRRYVAYLFLFIFMTNWSFTRWLHVSHISRVIRATLSCHRNLLVDWWTTFSVISWRMVSDPARFWRCCVILKSSGDFALLRNQGTRHPSIPFQGWRRVFSLAGDFRRRRIRSRRTESYCPTLRGSCKSNHSKDHCHK